VERVEDITIVYEGIKIVNEETHTHIDCTQITVRVTSTNTVINTSDAYSLDRAHTHSETQSRAFVYTVINTVMGTVMGTVLEK
jgi:hypothetical protein